MKALDEARSQNIKCVVWDLDNTIWQGIILEDADVSVRPAVIDIIKALDERGILQSISSKNDFNAAWQKLDEYGVAEYFLYPQINWNRKSESIRIIAVSLNIALDSIAFIDDQIFERAEVKYALPEVLCIDAAHIDGLLAMAELNPRFISADSKLRRKMYQSDIQRQAEQEKFNGAQEEFLASLDLVFSVDSVKDGDLQRAEELTVRTHQLNSTGYTYSYEELDRFRKSRRHKLFSAALEDKFGSYGQIGLALIECEKDLWTIKLLLMSCRVMSRGVGSVMINYISNLAQKNKVRLQAEFLATERNRMMYVAYKFAGFEEVAVKENLVLFENRLNQIQPFPNYLKVRLPEEQPI
jgi:FkbH-like protein